MSILKHEDNTYTAFKITPHAKNLNSTSRKFQKAIYELFSYKYPKYPWQREPFRKAFTKDNLYVSIRENPKFWWIVKMYAKEEEVENKSKANEVDLVSSIRQVIEFYIVVPTDFKEAFKTKFNNHEQWRTATLDELKEPFKFPKNEGTDMYNLKYTRNDMFSLKFDYSEQTTPIRDIMSVSRELQYGEEICLFVQTESVDRVFWKRLSDYSWDVWGKGKVPSKAGLDPKMVATDLAQFLTLGLHEAKKFVDDILFGISKSFFNDKSSKSVSERPIFVNAERESLLVDGNLSKMTLEKRNKPVFNTHILYTITSDDDVRKNMLSRSVSNSFSDLNKDNTLKPIKVNMKSKKELNELKNWKIYFANPNKMSTDEVGKIMQLPTADLQKEFEDSLDSNKRIEIEVHKELLDEGGILAGTTTNKGQKLNIHTQRKNEELGATSRAIMGSPRMGKDQYTINYIVESKLNHNIGAVILDVINENNGHRGMGDAIRDHLPPEEVIDLNLVDTDFPIYLGLEPIIKKLNDPRISSDRVAEELASFLLTDGDEDKLQTSEYLRDAAKFANADILGIKYMFTSESYRKKMLKEKGKIFDTTIWEEYDKLSDGKKQAIYTPVMRRIGQIYSSEFLKPIMCQTPNKNLDLFNSLLEGKVVIFRMKAGVMSQRVIEILCHWIILITYSVKLIQDGDTSQSKGTLLVLNEPDMYLTNESAEFVTRVFTQGPKYRLIPILIFHHFQKLAHLPGFVKKMKTSSLNWHIFKNTNDDVYKEMFPAYLSRTFESPEDAFHATKALQFIGVWLSSDGSYYDPFVADCLPMVKDRYKTYNNSNLTLTHSKIYGRPVYEVLEEIKLRNREARKPYNPEKNKAGTGSR